MITSIILAIIIGFLVNWSFSELLSIQSVISYFLISGIIAVLIYGFRPRAERFFKKSIEQQEKPNYDPKFLNDKIFRKLMRVRYNTNYKGDLIFEIPTDERAFRPRTSQTYYSWIMGKIVDFREDHNDAIDYVSIKSSIPNLEIGEKYLKFNHKEVYEMWSTVKQTLETHNEHRQNFKKQLGKMAIEKLKTEFPTFDSGKIDQPLKNDAYFIDNIQNFLFNTIGHEILDPKYDALKYLHNGFTGNTIYTLEPNSSDVLMASLDRNKIDVGKARLIFREIMTKNETIESFRKSVEIDSNFYDEVKKFSEKLEDEIVNEIDALRLS